MLDGPLRALAHLIEQLPDPLQPGEVVTTGTLTDAVPLTKGARWRTSLDGIALPGLDLTFF